MVAHASNFETAIVYADATERREKLEWWERGPATIAEERMGETSRRAREASWRMRHQQTYAVRCGDAWPAVLGKTHCLV